MAIITGVRVRVFGWSETWRIVPEPVGDRWTFRIGLIEGSTGMAAPQFLERTEWTDEDRARGLARIKEEIRERAELANRRAFMVDEEPEDLDGS